jgi:4-carboxymuconolactone decarboxylase
MNNEPRIQPKSMDEMRPDWLEILKRIPGDGLKGKYAPVNVLGSLMHMPNTLGPFLDYWVTSKQQMSFTMREQELVILRMAYHYQSNYVWKHHVHVALEYGINETEIAAVKTEQIPAVFAPRETAILALTDEMMNRRNVSDEAWSLHKKELSDTELIELISLVSQYVLFALTNNIVRTRIEAPLQEIEGF